MYFYYSDILGIKRFYITQKFEIITLLIHSSFNTFLVKISTV